MNRSATHIYIHATWSTAGRQPWLLGPVQDLAYDMIRNTCRWKKCDLIALGGIEDHPHLLVRMHPAVTVAYLVGQSKAYASGAIAERLLPHFEWQEGYWAESVSRNAIDNVARYIENQREHHARGDVIAAWEPHDDEQPRIVLRKCGRR